VIAARRHASVCRPTVGDREWQQADSVVLYHTLRTDLAENLAPLRLWDVYRVNLLAELRPQVGVDLGGAGAAAT